MTIVKFLLKFSLFVGFDTVADTFRVADAFGGLRGSGDHGLFELGDVGSHFFEEVDDAGALLLVNILIHNGYNIRNQSLREIFFSI